MIAAGLLRRRLAIEAPQEIDDGAGGVVRTFVETQRVWASVTATTLADGSVADRALGVVTHRVRLRAGAPVSTACRFRIGTRVLTILAVREVDAAGRAIECLCREERP